SDTGVGAGGHPAVRPGVSATVAISGQTYDNVLYIPRTAVFDIGGRPTVYVRAGGGFDAHEVRVKAWTDSLAVVENVEQSAELALVNPNAPGRSEERRVGKEGRWRGSADESRAKTERGER